MAEQEVIKHTKKIFTIWEAPGKHFWGKLKDFLLEIIIIVFAVSLSIYLHDRSEKKHQQHETKEFLLGIKEDLLHDIQEMQEDKKAFLRSAASARYVIHLKRNTMADTDSINLHYGGMFGTTSLVANNGRFEGFKSSGKIGNIENKELQNNLMDLYQENIPMLLSSTSFYNQRKQKFQDFIQQKRQRLNDSTTNLKSILAYDEAYNICGSLVSVDEILERYNICIEKIKLIIKDIDKEYKE